MAAILANAAPLYLKLLTTPINKIALLARGDFIFMRI
jgi:hypothetical protein